MPFLVWQKITREWGSFFWKDFIPFETPDGLQLRMIRKWHPDYRGKGAVLLIHGFAQNRYSWHLPDRSFVNYLAVNGYDVFNLELRGHGRSGFRSSPPELFEDYVEKDVPSAVKKVVEVSGEKKLFVIGHSLGGAIIYASAPFFKDHIRGIVTIGGVFLFGQGQKIFNLISKLAVTLDRNLRFLDLLGYVPFHIVGEILEKTTIILNSPLFRDFPITPWYPGSIERELARFRLKEGFDKTGINILKIMIKWASEGRFTDLEGKKDYWSEFVKLDVPLLVITGDRDTLCTHADAYPAYFFSQSRDKEYRIFTFKDGNTHWGHIDLIQGQMAPYIVWPYILHWMEVR